jgi:hypothetical protein
MYGSVDTTVGTALVMSGLLATMRFPRGRRPSGLHLTGSLAVADGFSSKGTGVRRRIRSEKALKFVTSPLALASMLAFAVSCHGAPQLGPSAAPTRATLSNGLRVVIVPDSIAPAATVELSVLAGGDESPRQFPGLAHAQEHMAFRGCSGMTADQTSAIYSYLGGENNAETAQNVTHYFVTVPSADLEVALRVQAACVHNIEDSSEEELSKRKLTKTFQIPGIASNGGSMKTCSQARLMLRMHWEQRTPLMS